MTVARCSVRSASLDEPMPGTASRIRRYLLIEVPGPWGVEALRDARLPDILKRELRRRSRSTGVRVLLIRRFGGPRIVRHPQVYIVDTELAPPTAAGGQLTDVGDVLDMSFWSTTSDTRSELDRHGEPLFLVCTHGRHDPCCAERGRPVARALSAAYPEQTWECSHMGGDRFAANLLCLPDGIAYGRVAPEDAAAIAREYFRGRLDLAHLRGRGRYPFAVQAAEWHLLTELQLTGVNDLVLAEHRLDEVGLTAVFTTASGDAWSVRMRMSHAPPRHVTCHAKQPFAAPQFHLLQISKV